MSIVEIISLSAIIAAFMLFAVVLAWGEHQTRGIAHPARKAPQQPASAGVDALKGAAAEMREPIHAA